MKRVNCILAPICISLFVFVVVGLPRSTIVWSIICDLAFPGLKHLYFDSLSNIGKHNILALDKDRIRLYKSMYASSPSSYLIRIPLHYFPLPCGKCILLRSAKFSQLLSSHLILDYQSKLLKCQVLVIVNVSHSVVSKFSWMNVIPGIN